MQTLSDNIAEIKEDDTYLQAVIAAGNAPTPKKPFYHSTRTEFKLKSHIRIDHVGKERGNRCYDLCPRGYYDAVKHKDLINDLLVYFDKDTFYLNEVPSGVQHRVFFDFDINLSELALDSIVEMLESVIVGVDPEVLVSRNETSGKIHIVTNVQTFTPITVKGQPELNIDRRAEMQYLRKYLFQAVDGEISKEDWMRNKPALFDVKAPGIRSVYSVKVDSGIIKSTDRYIPLDDCVAKDAIYKYSIYRQAPAKWNESIQRGIEEEKIEVVKEIAYRKEQKKKRLLKSEYDIITKKIPVRGVDCYVTQELIDEFCKNLPTEYASGGKWSVALGNVHAAGKLVSGGKFSPDYFLHSWSRENSPNEYERDDNSRKYENAMKTEITAGESGAAITWLKNMARVGEFRNKGSLIYSHPSTHQHEFANYIDTKIGDVAAWVKNNVVYIVNGGKSFYMTRNIVGGDINFSKVSSAELKDSPIQWQEGDKSLGLYSVIKSHIKLISYKRVDFMPHINGPADGVFNTFTGFRHQVIIPSPEDTSKIDFMLNHIRIVWCKENMDCFNYILNLFAHIVQKPNVKTRTAVVLKSKQGAGKSSVVEFMGKHVLGQRYYNYSKGVMELFDRFNSDMENKLITLVDETKTSEKTKDQIQTDLNAVITRTVMKVEYKGINKIPDSHDYNNFFFASNEDLPLYIDKDDRRFFILDCDNRFIGNRVYFNDLHNKMNDETGKHFYTYLVNRNISTFDPDVRPSTEIKNQMVEDSLPLYLKYFINYARENVEQPEYSMSCADSYTSFHNWCIDNGIKHIPSQLVFGRDVNKIMDAKCKRIDGKVIKYREISMGELKNKLIEMTRCDLQIDQEITPPKDIIIDGVPLIV